MDRCEPGVDRAQARQSRRTHERIRTHKRIRIIHTNDPGAGEKSNSLR